MPGPKSIPADQAWFWTEEWQAGEREAGEQAAAGDGTVFADGDALLDSLRQMPTFARLPPFDKDWADLPDERKLEFVLAPMRRTDPTGTIGL